MHYENNKGYDVIDFVQAYGLNFNRGSAIKYLVRAGKKDNEIKDLEKAIDFLSREIEFLREKQSKWIEENK
jgi:sulfur relay (sulfurtransferase) DsrC/TusE family protein